MPIPGDNVMPIPVGVTDRREFGEIPMPLMNGFGLAVRGRPMDPPGMLIAGVETEVCIVPCAEY